MVLFNDTTQGEILQEEILRAYLEEFKLPILPLPPKSKKAPPTGWTTRRFTFKDFQEDGNVALRLGDHWNGGYLACIDFDIDDEQAFLRFFLSLPAEIQENCVLARSGGNHKGYHVIFKVDKPLKNTKLPFGDLKGKGGYILIEPSKVEARYRFISPDDPLKAFEKLREAEAISVDLLQETLSYLDIKTVDLEQLQHEKKITKSVDTSIEESKIAVDNKNNNLREKNNSISQMDDRIVLSDEVVAVENKLEVDQKNVFVKADFSALTLEKFEDIWKSTEVWRRVLSLFGLKAEQIRLDKAFNCVVKKAFTGEEDKNPSAELHRFSDGVIRYVDFHQSGEKKIRSIEEIYYLWKYGKNVILKKQEMRLILNEMILDLNIWTDESVELNWKLITLKRKLASLIPERWLRVVEVIFDKLVEAKRLDLPQGAVMSSRWIGKKACVRHLIANQVVNFLCAIGVMKKNGRVNLPQGWTEYLQPLEFEVDEVISKAKKLINYLANHGGFSKFSRKAVREVFGEEKVAEIFHREYDKPKKPKKPKERRDEEIITLYTIGMKVLERLNNLERLNSEERGGEASGESELPESECGECEKCEEYEHEKEKETEERTTSKVGEADKGRSRDGKNILDSLRCEHPEEGYPLSDKNQSQKNSEIPALDGAIRSR